MRIATKVAALTLAAMFPTGTAHAADPALAAEFGAGYLAAQLGSNGLASGPGGADYNTTAGIVLALVATGTAGEATTRATDALAANVAAYVLDSGGKDRAGALGTLILVSHATGRDPRAFGGVNLVDRLIATKQTTGADVGLFGAQDATYDGAYRQSLGLLGLATAGATDADAIGWLRTEQCSDGGWMGNNPDPSAATCPPFDSNSFVGEDSNSTAIAAMALRALNTAPLRDPLIYLRSVQNADGGIGFNVGAPSDANSTALTVQTLFALGADFASFDKPDGTPLSFLTRLQIGCEPADKAGAFAFQPNADGTLTANTFATVQVVPALAGQAFPIKSQPQDSGPGTRCSLAAPPDEVPPPDEIPLPDEPITSLPVEGGDPVIQILNTTVVGAPTLPATGPRDAVAAALLGLTLLSAGTACIAASRRSA